MLRRLVNLVSSLSALTGRRGSAAAPDGDGPPARGTVECGDHGTGYQTFVCRHLADGTGRGFVFFEEPDNPYPDAWCDACEVVREEVDGWDEESERTAGITLRCHHCYIEIRDRANAADRSGS